MNFTRIFSALVLSITIGATAASAPQKKSPLSCQGATLLTSWYCLQNRTKANNLPMDCMAMEAANNELALGTKLRLKYRGHSVDVVVSDRGPFVKPRQLDVSQGVARLLGFERQGVACVSAEVVRTPDYPN